MCLDPGSNWGPIPLQGSALPTELSRHYLFSIPLQGSSLQELYTFHFLSTNVQGLAAGCPIPTLLHQHRYLGNKLTLSIVLIFNKNSTILK